MSLALTHAACQVLNDIFQMPKTSSIALFPFTNSFQMRLLILHGQAMDKATLNKDIDFGTYSEFTSVTGSFPDFSVGTRLVVNSTSYRQW